MSNSKTKKFIVGRPINGISINGLEFLLDDDGKCMEFPNEEAAKTYLLDKGVSPENIEGFTFTETDSDDEPSDSSRFEFERLMSHVGHNVVVVNYAGDWNVSVECEDCNEVLYSVDNPDVQPC